MTQTSKGKVSATDTSAAASSSLSDMGNKHGFERRCALALAIAAGLSLGVQSNAQAQLFPPVVNLGSLNGANGFRLDGQTADDRSGRSVSGAGDINGDGIDDLIIGASRANSNGSLSGSSYVVFGKNTATAGSFPATLALGDLDGSNGFRLDGQAMGDQFGLSVSGVGDINGDGIDDLIIGAYRADPNGNDRAGSSYVVFGKNTATAGSFPATLALGDLDGSNGFRLDGQALGDQSGGSVSGAGDINGDGIDDLIVGANGTDPNGNFSSGSSYVVFGKDTAKAGSFPATIALSELDGNIGFRLDGQGFELSGYSVSTAGDLNGDGVDDLIIGAVFAPYGSTSAGSGYVVFGKNTATAGSFPATLALGDLDGSNGFRLDGQAFDDRSGNSVSAVGDINSDGIDDLIIGAVFADPNGNAFSGSSYVVFGKDTAIAGPFPATLALGSLSGGDGFRLDGQAADDRSGRSVSGAGDINGDGIDDLIIGASRANSNGSLSGSSYVVFGKNTATAGSFPATLALGDLDGSNGFRLDGQALGDQSGGSVSGAGDINGDGIDDLIVGAFGADLNGSYSGSSYVVFGSTDVVFADGFEDG